MNMVLPQTQVNLQEVMGENDLPLLVAVLSLLMLGLVMVASSSLHLSDRQVGDPLFYLVRQMIFAAIGLLLGYATTKISLKVWQRYGSHLFVLGLLLLIVVLIPGVGKVVNGSYRWIPLGVFNLQVSELVKLFTIIYFAGYLVRHAKTVQCRVRGFLLPMLLLGFAGVLLLLEPDFGSTVVILATTLGMMFLGGARLKPFYLMVAAAAVCLSVLVLVSPYRMARAISFLDPWKDQFGGGYQLTQALIAFGQGDWLGVGLGNSVQKIFYLPEAYTDFLISVLAEELGVVAVCLVISAYGVIIWRCFRIGGLAEQVEMRFQAFLAYGVGMWLGLQGFINLGVNMGLLPTKGLTLPLMSYGGSSLIITCVAIGLVLRAHDEIRQQQQGQEKEAKKWVCA